MVKAIVGANWGDEGKGKVTDMLAEKADVIIRYQGGFNAGHTIVNNYGKFALHLLPSGVFYDHTTSVIANGVALEIPAFIDELKGLTDKGVPMPKILVSDRANVVMPYHKLLDRYEEERLGKAGFGSTKSGMAPCYSDRYAKIGFQVNELFNDETLKEKIHRVAELKNVLLENLYHKPLIDEKELYDEMVRQRELIRPFVADTTVFLHNAIKEGKSLLLEGQLGAMRDIDLGIYPMTTSSSTLAGFGASGAGIPPYEIKQTSPHGYTRHIGFIGLYRRYIAVGFVAKCLAVPHKINILFRIFYIRFQSAYIGAKILPDNIFTIHYRPINLIAPCVKSRHDNSVKINGFCQGFKGRNPDTPGVICPCHTFYRRKTYPKACKRAGAYTRCEQVHLLNRKAAHIKGVFYHWHKILRMGCICGLYAGVQNFISVAYTNA